MNTIKKNIVANYAGNIWQSLMGIAFVPLYIKFMGIESYGLVGIFAILQAMFAILDMGIGITLTREMARLSALPNKAQEMRDLLRSLEMVNWGVAIIIGSIVVAMAPFIAHHWIKPGQLSPFLIERAIIIMGLCMAFQWPGSFYSGGLNGLQKQVSLNVINAGVSTLRGVGAIGILWLVSPTIQAFFLWQAVISVLGTFCLGFFLWHQLPQASGRAVVRKELLAGIWKFAAGMSGMSILGMILSQLDKIILSKILPLEVFGYYALAGTVAVTLYRLVGPVYSAVYPRITQLISIGDQQGLKELYHKSCQLMSVLILPVAVVIAVFSFEILLLWTHNSLIAQKAHLLLSVLMLGTALSGLMNIPAGLLYAHGRVKLGVYTNVIGVIFLVPLIFFLTKRYGALGGASAWVILNSGYVFIVVPLIHKRFLPNENRHWYIQDTGFPFIASVVLAGVGRIFITNTMSKPVMILSIMAVSIISFGGAVMATSTTRSWLLNNLSKKKMRFELAGKNA